MANTEQQPEVTIQATEPTIEPATKTTNSKKRLWVIVAVAVTAGVALIVGLAIYFVLNVGGYAGEQRKLENYLREKYGQEFVVGRPGRKGAGIGVEGRLEAVASPKRGEPGIVFKVWNSSYGLGDNYLNKLWEKQEYVSQHQYITGLFNDNLLNYGVTIGLIYGHESEIAPTETGFSQALKNHGPHMSYSLQVKVTDTTHNYNQKSHTAKIFQLIEHLKALGVGSVNLGYNVQTDTISYSCGLANSEIQLINSIDNSILNNCLKKD